MIVHRMSDAEFKTTLNAPMRLLEDPEEVGPFDLHTYVRECFQTQGLAPSADDLTIPAVYRSGDARFTHIRFSYGPANVYLVIVIDSVAKAIEGYHWLDLNQQYGLA